jgi:hypothetical protein
MNALLLYAALTIAMFLPPLARTQTPPQAHLNHTAQLTIDGKNTHSYTVQFSQNGDTTQRVTSYFDNAQRLVRVEITKFRTKPLALFSNKIDDYRTGEFLAQDVSGSQSGNQSGSQSGSRFTTRRRERKGEVMQEKSVTAENGIVATLVSERAGESVGALDKGQSVKFTLVLPALGMVTEMKLEKTGNETVSGVSCITVKLEPSNFMLKALMSEVSYFTFERAAPHRFMQYKGILGIPNDEGKQQSGVAVMKY